MKLNFSLERVLLVRRDKVGHCSAACPYYMRFFFLLDCELDNEKSKAQKKKIIIKQGGRGYKFDVLTGKAPITSITSITSGPELRVRPKNVNRSECQVRIWHLNCSKRLLTCNSALTYILATNPSVKGNSL